MHVALRDLKAYVALRDLKIPADVTQAIATWVVVLRYFAAGIVRDPLHVGTAGLAVLAFAAFIVFRQPIPRHAMGRICLTAAVLTLLLCGYLVSGSWPSAFGTPAGYDAEAVKFVVSYVALGAFAVLFFEERLFERVVWRAATVALWVGVVSCLASRLSHRILLVSASHGALRLLGTLSEPSAWAPVISLVVLLAIRRRSWLYLALAFVGVVLAASPTCILVLVATVSLYYALTGTRRQRLTVLLSLAVFIPVAVFFLQTARPDRYLDSHNTAEVALGRLVSGIRNVETGGKTGHNTRFASTRVVIADATANGWLHTGAGPAADITYFAAKYPDGTRPEAYRPNSLWVEVLFDFGEVGVVVLGIFMLTSAWRMRHRPEMCAILLPFFVASLINSAEGFLEYSFVALGIMLFAFGWGAPRREVSSAPLRRSVTPG
jgi:hypothetical protein